MEIDKLPYEQLTDLQRLMVCKVNRQGRLNEQRKNFSLKGRGFK